MPSTTARHISILLAVLSSNGIALSQHRELVYIGVITALTMMLGYYRVLTISRQFGLFLIAFGIWTIAIAAKYGIDIRWEAYIGMIVIATIGYLPVRICRRHIISDFISVSVGLTSIALVLFAFQVVVPGAFKQVAEAVKIVPLFAGEAPSRTEVIVYAYDSNHPFSNFGFMWEPAAFAAVTGIAMAAQLLRDGWRVRGQTIVLGAGVASSTSATGFVILIVAAASLVVVYVWHGARKKKTWWLLAISVAISPVLLTSVPKKELLQIQHELIEASQLSGYQRFWEQAGPVRTPTRFESFYLDSLIILDNPVVGAGLANDTRYPMPRYTASVSGVTDPAAKMGIAWCIALWICIYRTGSRISPGANQTTRRRKGLYFLAFVLMAVFGEVLLLTPVGWMLVWASGAKTGWTPHEWAQYRSWTRMRPRWKLEVVGPIENSK